MLEFGLAAKWQEKIKRMLHIQLMTREEIDNLLQTLLPNPKKHSRNRRIVLESTALAYYQR